MSPASPKLASPRTLSIINAVIFDGDSPDRTEGAICVADGRIEMIGPEAARTADVVLDARGRTVIPGLIDAHFHAYGIDLSLLGIESRPLSYVSLAAAQRLDRALARGFTTVRDPAGGDAGMDRAIAEGLIRAPRYLWLGPALSQTGGHADSRGADSDTCGCYHHVSEVVDGVDQLRVAVRDRFRRGAHAIKIMTSGGVMSLTDPIRIPQYSAEEVRAVTDEAARRGSYVAAHAYSPEAIRHSIDNGVRSIEHGNLLDADTAQRMSAAGAFLVPTLVAYDAFARRGAEFGATPASLHKNREVLDAGLAAIECAHAAGVPVGFGTDLMGVLEDEQLVGLRLQVEVDGPLRVLRSATSVNAELLGRADLGRIRPGAVADLVVLDGDPFDDPPVLWRGDRTVIQRGLILRDGPALRVSSATSIQP